MPRAQLVFSLVALLVVVTLVVGALGTAIVDGLTNSGQNQEPATIDPNEPDAPDAYETSLRTQVAANPSDAASLALLANTLAQSGRLSEAIDYYEKALELDPENWTLRLDFARSLADGGKRNDAEFQFKKIVAGQPANYEAHYYLAELYRNWLPPRNDEAAAEYRRTIEVGPGTYVAELAAQALKELGYATPEPAASPVSPKTEATP
ncbi:MAG TPA: tetratricopeptide repeat protein [Thermomicrobiales bacterium]|jgi:cytochrome c-type biogenesis protein CcmH/NrfG